MKFTIITVSIFILISISLTAVGLEKLMGPIKDWSWIFYITSVLVTGLVHGYIAMNLIDWIIKEDPPEGE